MSHYAARARRIDANQPAIVAALRKMGWLVHPTNGDWDLTIAKGDKIRLLEVKDGSLPPSRRRLTDNERAMVDAGWPIDLVSSVEDALALIR